MCAERVKTTETNFVKGRRGLANLIRISPTKARVDFHADEKMKLDAVSYNVEVTFGEDGSMPDCVPFKIMKDKSTIAVSATMNEDGTKILFAVPASGYFDAKFDRFVPEKGTKFASDDAPVMTSKKGKKNDYRDFQCLIELTGGMWQGIAIKDGVWKGAKYWYRMYDRFVEGSEGGLAVGGSGDGSDALNDFLDATVAGGSHIPFSENPLPDIQKDAIERGATFSVNVVKGWIQSIVVPLSLDTDTIGFLEEEDVPEALKESE